MDKLSILKELKDKINKNLNNIVNEIILFGSQASNNAHEHSDYDLLIIIQSNVTPEMKEQIIAICYDIDLKYDILTDTHIISTNELNTLRGKQPIYTNAINDGIHV